MLEHYYHLYDDEARRQMRRIGLSDDAAVRDRRRVWCVAVWCRGLTPAHPCDVLIGPVLAQWTVPMGTAHPKCRKRSSFG